MWKKRLFECCRSAREAVIPTEQLANFFVIQMVCRKQTEER